MALFSLDRTRYVCGTENRTGAIGNNESWFVSLSRASMNNSESYKYKPN